MRRNGCSNALQTRHHYPSSIHTRRRTAIETEEFVALLRTGRFPDGSPIGPNMPVKYLEKMSDDDFRAIYAYLQSLDPLPDNK